MSRPVPAIRVSAANDAPLRGDGEIVLYWMIAARRAHWNFALDRAREWGRELRKPVVVLEPLRCDYPWASERFHRFVLEGMADNARDFAATDVSYYPYLEPAPGAGRGLLEALAARAAVVVTDDFPCFFVPRMVAAAAARLSVTVETVDGNGLLPWRAAHEVFPTAFAFRRFLQRTLPEHLGIAPSAVLSDRGAKRRWTPPDEVMSRWPALNFAEGIPDLATREWARLPIDRRVRAAAMTGGARAARRTLDDFIHRKLTAYPENRNVPDLDGASGLSPYLHFGHIAPHEVFASIVEREAWTPDRLSAGTRGGREGWWGMSPAAEAFLDQLITWRELGFNFAARRDDYDRYESLPEWAQRTLAEHTADRRPHVYATEEFATAATHDPLWNAAQTQLIREGRLHNYLRMLWGKKILEWSESPQAALATMIELNNRYAVDGRDPNSYSGIFWVLGRYDRPWGPERPIFGKVRYMTSENTARKFSVREYLARYAPEATP